MRSAFMQRRMTDLGVYLRAGWAVRSGADIYDVTDDNDHRTHVAGTIGATGNNGLGVSGVAWNVKLLPVKVLDASGAGSFQTIIAGVNYVTSLKD